MFCCATQETIAILAKEQRNAATGWENARLNLEGYLGYLALSRQ